MFDIKFESERQMEDYIAEQIKVTGCCPIADEDVDFHLRQHQISGYGITDIIKFTALDPGSLQVTILELKNEPLKPDHISQLCRYIAGANRIARRYSRRYGINISVYGELAGPCDINANDLVFMLDCIDREQISVYATRLTAEEGFSSKSLPAGWSYAKADRRLRKDLHARISNLMDAQLNPKNNNVVGFPGAYK